MIVSAVNNISYLLRSIFKNCLYKYRVKSTVVFV